MDFEEIYDDSFFNQIISIVQCSSLLSSSSSILVSIFKKLDPSEKKKPWMTTNNQYRRCGESFLWRMKRRRSITATPELEVVDDNDIDIFPWTGENDLCQLFADDKIACGGGVVGTGDGFGIVLNSDLMSGSSSPCLTYGNPSLCTLDGEESLDGQFEVANIEVWALTSYMFVADAEKSEKSLKLLKDNSFAEGETPSTTSPWSNFL